MGRDLSSGGMRVERLADMRVGDRFRLALYGASSSDPFHVDATVIRDDGDSGFALVFEPLPAKTAEALEKFVACLPDVESLDDDESFGLGAVISEIIYEKQGR